MKTIKDIIDKFNKLTPEDIDDYCEAQTFVEENESLYHDCLYNEPMLDLSKEKVEQFLKSSLTSLLDSIKTDIEKTKEEVRKQTGSYKYNDQYDDCINIINSHK
jgi:hypothetical protein